MDSAIGAFRQLAERQAVMARVAVQESKAHARIVCAAAHQVEAAKVGVAKAHDVLVEAVGLVEIGGGQHDMAHPHVAVRAVRAAGDETADACGRDEGGIVDEAAVEDFHRIARRVR